jgi:hypothetical protein
MKNQDDGTLSLFDDFPASNAAPADAVKKPRAKRTTSAKVEVLEDVPAVALADTPVETPSAAAEALQPAAAPALAPMPSVDVEATLQLANLVPTPPKRQNPWAKPARNRPRRTPPKNRM